MNIWVAFQLTFNFGFLQPHNQNGICISTAIISTHMFSHLKVLTQEAAGITVPAYCTAVPYSLREFLSLQAPASIDDIFVAFVKSMCRRTAL